MYTPTTMNGGAMRKTFSTPEESVGVMQNGSGDVAIGEDTRTRRDQFIRKFMDELIQFSDHDVAEILSVIKSTALEYLDSQRTNRLKSLEWEKSEVGRLDDLVQQFLNGKQSLKQ